MTDKSAYRTAMIVAVASTFILLWMNLAVGLIGNEENPANLFFGGVFAVGIIGATIARFRSRPMARVMIAMALVQFMVPVIALMIFQPPMTSREEIMGVLGVFGVNAIFAALFAASALLFQRASRHKPEVEPVP